MGLSRMDYCPDVRRLLLYVTAHYRFGFLVYRCLTVRLDFGAVSIGALGLCESSVYFGFISILPTFVVFSCE